MYTTTNATSSITPYIHFRSSVLSDRLFRASVIISCSLRVFTVSQASFFPYSQIVSRRSHRPARPRPIPECPHPHLTTPLPSSSLPYDLTTNPAKTPPPSRRITTSNSPATPPRLNSKPPVPPLHPRARSCLRLVEEISAGAEEDGGEEGCAQSVWLVSGLGDELVGEGRGAWRGEGEMETKKKKEGKDRDRGGEDVREECHAFGFRLWEWWSRLLIADSLVKEPMLGVGAFELVLEQATLSPTNTFVLSISQVGASSVGYVVDLQ